MISVFGRLFLRCNCLICCIMKKFLFRFVCSFFMIAAILLVIVVFSSCNVTRKVTTESSYFQKGDTSCTITVKTVESYDATKKLSN